MACSDLRQEQKPEKLGAGQTVFAPISNEQNGPFPDTTTISPPIIPHYSGQKNFQVKYGDTFNDILKSLRVSKNIINEVVSQISSYVPPKDFKVGNTYQVFFDTKTGNPYLMSYDLSDTSAMQMNLISAEVSLHLKPITVQVTSAIGVIHSSLVNSIVSAELPKDLADRILSIFAWKIDFKNLKNGDSYRIIFDQLTVENEIIGSGKIHVIIFEHDGQIYEAYGFNNGNGIEYFDKNGLNMSYAPLQFDRITSLYAQRRFHPTRRRSLPHYGMDFEAALGTPIESSLDGIITRVRYDRANGNNVKIRHSKDLTTQYLHLSQIDSAMIVGDSVKQGQIIGLVGSTGYSSGPHLCLRVWYMGKQRDPLKFDFPRREDIKDSLMENFKSYVENQLIALPKKDPDLIN